MSIKYPFLDLKPVNKPFEEALKQAACDVISSGRYINGKYVSLLEQEISKLCETKYAIAVSNGLDALKLIVKAYKELGEFSQGDEIIMSANTYIASALAVSSEGLNPVFVDMSPTTLNINTDLIEKAITSRTVAIMPVHLYGTPCWDEKLKSIAKNYNLKIIEDNAQAIGAKAAVNGINCTQTTGGLGNAAGISFYPTKNLGALGDAGMVVTNHKDLADTIRAIANYGADTRYHNLFTGYNCRMDEIQAAMLLVKLPYLKAETDRRIELINIYNNTLSNSNITKPKILENTTQVWHQYPLRVKDRDKFITYMSENGVDTDIIYPTSVYNQPCYTKEFNNKFHCKEAEQFANEVVCLPIGAHITAENAKEIASIANRF